jgi:hypothetical protein
MSLSREEAAARLGLSTREVTAVRGHEPSGGTIASLSAGRPEHLVTETVARRYVPDVDDRAAEVEAEVPEPLPKRPARKST